MSIRAKLLGGCDALLLTLMGVFQIGMLIAVASVAPVRRDPIELDTAHVEVIVVAASKISRG